MQIALCYVLISLLEVHILDTPDQEDALALAHVHWLHNKSLVILFLIKL
jgi:hypothetical protein